MKILNATLILAIGLVSGFGLTIAIPVLAAPDKMAQYRYTQDTYRSGKWETTVVQDKVLKTACYHSVFRGGSLLVTSSCVKL